MKQAWIYWLCLGVGAYVGYVYGYQIGARDAAEHFYGACLGGEVYVERSSGTQVNLVGCAEIARNIR